MELTGNAVVNGDVKLGPTGTSRVEGNAVVTGSIDQAAAPFNCAPLELSLVRARVQAENDNEAVPPTARGLSVWQGSSAQGDLQVGGGDSATLPEGTYFMSRLEVTEGATLTATGPVTIFLAGTLHVSDQGQFLAQPGPILVLSDSTGKHHVASGVVQMVLYGPLSSLDVSGESRFEGAVWVEQAKVSGQGEIWRTAALEAGALRGWLVGELLRASASIEQALQQADAATRNLMIEMVIRDLEEVFARMDGSFGGDAGDDWIRDPADQVVLAPLVRDLISRLQSRMVAIPGPPQVFP